MQEGKPRRGFISIAPRQPQAHVGFIMSLAHLYLAEVAQISDKYLREMEHLRRSNTFHTPQPHMRRRRTWGYRGATSATWQTPLGFVIKN